jgi:hypothetical protein
MNHEQPPVPHRESPELLVTIGGMALTLTYENAGTFFYKAPFQQFNHFRVLTDSLIEQQVFGHKDTFQDLFMLGFPYTVVPYPEPETVDAYVAWQTERLGTELDEQ